ncbi:MAG: hypothetical protein CUN52_13560, partial [Phototrophicales bacterium]
TQPTIAPQKSTPPPPDEPPATGTPPIIPKQKIANDWGELLKVLHRINKHAPAVLEYYRVYRVEGNTVYLATDNQLYFERLHNQAEKLAVIEVAFKTLYQKRLRVQVVMVSDINQLDRELDPKLKDPIAQEAVTLGGEVKPDAPKARKKTKKEGDEA